MTVLISIAVAMAAGLLMTRAFNLFKMPDVTAYLVAGILIGPAVLGRLGIPGLGFSSYEELARLDILSNLALGFIAFAIGAEFTLPKLRSTGRQAVVIAVVQAVMAVVFVTAALSVCHFVFPEKLSLPVAITLGAIASATAPAATLMVIRQYKAKGAVSDILLPVVALDDAVGLVCFAIATGIAGALQGGAVDAFGLVVNPLLEIVGSLALGSVLGWVLTQVEKLYHSNRNRLTLIISMVTLTVALSSLSLPLGRATLSFSPLLVCMMLGTVFCNLCPMAEDLMDREDRWTAPLYCLFFVLSGAALQLDVFSDPIMVVIGVVYILVRALGKYFGSRWSAQAVKCASPVGKYLGITLFPQAGVALGMSLTAASQLGADGSVVRSITLFGVLIYELVGPTLTKIALTRAGDIKPMSDEVKYRRHNTLAAKSK